MVPTIFLAAIMLPMLACVTVGHAAIVHIGISTRGLYEIPTEIAQRKGFYKQPLSQGSAWPKITVCHSMGRSCHRLLKKFCTATDF